MDLRGQYMDRIRIADFPSWQRGHQLLHASRYDHKRLLINYSTPERKSHVQVGALNPSTGQLDHLAEVPLHETQQPVVVHYDGDLLMANKVTGLVRPLFNKDPAQRLFRGFPPVKAQAMPPNGLRMALTCPGKHSPWS